MRTRTMSEIMQDNMEDIARFAPAGVRVTNPGLDAAKEANLLRQTTNVPVITQADAEQHARELLGL